MGHRKPVPHIPAIREQVTRIDMQEHLEQLTKAHAGIAAAIQLERELVARVLMEGGSWDDVASATGMTKRAARRRWSAAPEGNIKDTKAVLGMIRSARPGAQGSADFNSGG